MREVFSGNKGFLRISGERQFQREREEQVAKNKNKNKKFVGSKTRKLEVGESWGKWEKMKSGTWPCAGSYKTLWAIGKI